MRCIRTYSWKSWCVENWIPLPTPHRISSNNVIIVNYYIQITLKSGEKTTNFLYFNLP